MASILIENLEKIYSKSGFYVLQDRISKLSHKHKMITLKYTQQSLVGFLSVFMKRDKKSLFKNHDYLKS